MAVSPVDGPCISLAVGVAPNHGGARAMTARMLGLGSFAPLRCYFRLAQKGASELPGSLSVRARVFAGPLVRVHPKIGHPFEVRQIAGEKGVALLQCAARDEDVKIIDHFAAPSQLSRKAPRPLCSS